MREEAPKPDLVTSPQASVIAECSHRTIHRAAAAGELTPAMQLPGPNGAMLFHRADVEAFRDRRRAKAHDDEPEPNGARVA